MAKTEFLQIRLTPEDSRHLRRVAEADHLDESTWGRRAILQALERWDAEHASGRPAVDTQAAGQHERRKVAESKPVTRTQPPTKPAAGPRGKRTSHD